MLTLVVLSRHPDHWKWHKFGMESQDVLIWGYIPGTAVLASIPLAQILNKLPSYFLTTELDPSKDGPMSRLAWDYRRKKRYFLQYCQEISTRFLRMPDERRLRDATAGAARLALAFLRPWFHKLVLDDFTAAVTTVCELACVIAQWPSQSWARDHPEARDLVRCIVHMVAEEVREARRLQALADAARMQDIVKGFENLALERKSYPSIPSESEMDDEQPASVTEENVEDIKERDLLSPRKHTSEASIQTEVEVQPSVPPRAAPAEPKSVPSESTESKYSIERIARTTSCFMTGFFFGSFITLCMLAPDRRELANWLS